MLYMLIHQSAFLSLPHFWGAVYLDSIENSQTFIGAKNRFRDTLSGGTVFFKCQTAFLHLLTKLCTILKASGCEV